jgi:hypothetical protein
MAVVSFSGLVDRLDEEADDVENRALKRENARRDAMVYAKWCPVGRRP